MTTSNHICSKVASQSGDHSQSTTYIEYCGENGSGKGMSLWIEHRGEKICTAWAKGGLEIFKVRLTPRWRVHD